MRLYVPATLDELASATVTPERATWTVPARPAHGVTPALRGEVGEEDEELLEHEAYLAAARDSLLLIAASPEGPALRVVVTVEVSDDAVHGVHHARDEGAISSQMCVHAEIPGVPILALHVDEPEAIDDVKALLAAAGGESAEADELLAGVGQRIEERSLLWYAPEELAYIPRS
jgi:hypothetical protein